MTIKETKRWLGRGKYIKQEIKHLQKRAKEAEDIATSITSSPDAIVVQGSKDPHKFDKVVELNDELYAQLHKCETILGEIQQVIDILEEPRDRDVLGRYYIDGQSAYKISFDYNCTQDNIYRILHKAQKIIRDYLTEYKKIQS